MAFVGCGLIGSSMIRAIRRASLARRILVVEKSESRARHVVTLGLADRASTEPALVAEADLVVVAVPMGAYEEVAAAIAPHLGEQAIVTDVGSTKRAAIEAFRRHLVHPARIVPGHPVAGTEHSGPEAGFAELFQGRWTILTPLPETAENATMQVATLWRTLGAEVEVMDPVHHDRVMAVVSHIPHLIAYAIVGTASHLEEVTEREVIKYAAGGFRDFTRIAASDPVMWRDIFLANKDAVFTMLERLKEDIGRLERAMAEGDAKTLEDWFRRTRAIRRGILEIERRTGAIPSDATDSSSPSKPDTAAP
ncbi:MAG: prephenate/arogenate dehydrogenase family protein [Alphaproteobacteria bacterium]|nr:MAG: prephenate/arogenate dehydrogenase family protein [Alphaproteobacteria bacterium]